VPAVVLVLLIGIDEQRSVKDTALLSVEIPPKCPLPHRASTHKPDVTE
jgi:hypothetical protein